ITSPEPRAPKATGLPRRSAVARYGLSALTTNMPGVEYIAKRIFRSAGGRPTPVRASWTTSPWTRAMSSCPASRSGTYSVLPLVLRGWTASGAPALEHTRAVVVRKRGDKGRRQEEAVVGAEVLLPDGARRVGPAGRRREVLERRRPGQGLLGRVRRVLVLGALAHLLDLIVAQVERKHRVEEVEVGVVLLSRDHALGPALFELDAGAAQRLDRPREHVPHVRRDAARGVVEDEADSVVGETRASGGRQRPPVGGRVLLVGAAEHLERRSQVGRAARERARDGQERGRARRRPGRRGNVPAHGHDAARRLVAVDAAEVRGHADRAADVAAGFQVREAGGQRRRAAAGRAARRAPEGPGVVAGAEDVVVALPVGGPGRHVGLAENDGARAPEAGGDDRIARGDVVLERRRACRRPDARDLERVLHGARHAVERPPPVTPSARLVGRAGSRERGAASRSSAVVYPHAARKSFAPPSASSCFTSSRVRMRSSTNHRRAASPSATSSRRIVRLGRRASLPYT